MGKQVSKEALYDNLSLELHRGVTVLAVLSRLQNEAYGYALKQALAEQGIDINEGTLYPLLRRLEKQGLLESNWRVVDDARPRRYYHISPVGSILLSNLQAEWQALVQKMNRLLTAANGDKQ